MAPGLPYTVFSLGKDVNLHQIHSPQGKLFVMGEVAVELFQETPTTLLQELRKGKHTKFVVENKDVLQTVADLGLPVESMLGSTGITMLPTATIQALLYDRRKYDLIQPFKLALLKLASQEAARLMATGAYEKALPVALDAVEKGQDLFKPQPALQLFPLYLLAAQANLGVKRLSQCEDFLGLASWLAMREPELTSNIMRSQLARLYGQLYALQGRHQEALEGFSEDVYHCSLEYGPDDVRTSLGYYNLGKVFQAQDSMDKCLACTDQVVQIWNSVLQYLLLERQSRDNLAPPPKELPLGKMQLIEVVDMLQDIARIRSEALGPNDISVADANFVTALCVLHLGETGRAQDLLDQAVSLFPEDDRERQEALRAASGLMQPAEA